MLTLSRPPRYFFSPMINLTIFTPTSVLPKCVITGVKASWISKCQQLRTKTLQDYFQQSRHLLTKSDGGPPRWFSPLECASRLNNAPLLLVLPGLDGNGLALFLHHQRLDLVKLVKRTVKSENDEFPKRPIYLVGESMGGCLALAVAAHTPDIDLVLILANPATSFGKSQLQPVIPIMKTIPEQLRHGLPYLLTFMTGVPSQMIMSSAEKGSPSQQTVTDLSENLAALFSFATGLDDVFTTETLLWKLTILEAAYEYSNASIHSVTAQTIVLSSGKDQLLPSLEEGQRLRRIMQNCQIRTFNDCGHALFLEEGFDF